MIEAKRYKNGSIHLHGSIDKDIAECDIVQVLWALEEVDTYLIGEEWSAGNWDCGITVYSYYSDLCYDLIEGYSIERIEEGKTLILRGREVTEWDQENIAREYGTEDTDISTEATNDTNIA